MSERDPIYVLDEIDLRPGMLEPFLETLEADYAPGAAARGMRRLHTWVTPPFELAAGGTQVLIVWQVDGVEGFHDLKVRSAAGSHYVEIHAVVDPDLTVRQGHDIAEAVERALLALDEVVHVIVHVDPHGPDQTEDV